MLNVISTSHITEIFVHVLWVSAFLGVALIKNHMAGEMNVPRVDHNLLGEEQRESLWRASSDEGLGGLPV